MITFAASNLLTRNFAFGNSKISVLKLVILSFQTLFRNAKIFKFQLVLLSFETLSFDFLSACLQGGGGPQVGEVTTLAGAVRLLFFI